MKQNRKSQEEMVGFVMIVVLIIVIGVIFLFISMRNTSESYDNSKINSFLESLLIYTTDCQKNNISYESMTDLIDSCRLGDYCLDGTPSCDKLNETLKNIINAGFKNSGYELTIKANNESVFSLNNRKSAGNMQGAEMFIAGSNTKLRLRIFSES